MAGNFMYKVFLIGLLLYIRPLISAGSDGRPVNAYRMNLDRISRSSSDTIPENKTDNKKVTDQSPVDKPVETIIKEVPKSRKQIKPIAVTNGLIVKPVRVIKPKIIKPVIKIH